MIEILGRLKATSRRWIVGGGACQPCAAAAFLCSKQPPVVRRGSKRVRLVETRAAWPFQIEGAAGWCQNTVTHAPQGQGYSGSTPQCMPLMILAEGMGADRCGEGEGASGAPDLQGDQRTGEKVGERASFKGKRSGQI